MNAADCHLPLVRGCWEPRTGKKNPGWVPVGMILPWKRLSDLPLSQVRSARISLLPGAVENSMLSLQALWRSHLSGWNCSSHTLWTRAWPPSLTCDQHPFGIVVTADSFGRECGAFSYESLCSWGWALARPPLDWTVALLLSRGWDLALAKEHTHASEAWRCFSL